MSYVDDQTTVSVKIIYTGPRLDFSNQLSFFLAPLCKMLQDNFLCLVAFQHQTKINDYSYSSKLGPILRGAQLCAFITLGKNTDNVGTRIYTR